MVGENGNRIVVKLVNAHYQNLIFYVPTKEGTKKLRIRWVNHILYLQRLVKFIEKNGETYTKLVHSIYNGETYADEISEVELTKEQLLTLLDKPGRKSEKYEKLMQLLREV